MKQMLDDVYRLADHKGVAVILDTDDKNKCQRYEHLGMRLDRIRKCGDDLNMYDLIRESKEYGAFVATHDPELCAQCCDRIIRIRAGRSEEIA